MTIPRYELIENGRVVRTYCEDDKGRAERAVLYWAGASRGLPGKVWLRDLLSGEVLRTAEYKPTKILPPA